MSEPTCIITGYAAGHPCACGDCDPCLAWMSVSPEGKRLVTEIAEWMQRFEDAASRADDLEAAIRDAHSALDDHLGDSDLDHFETPGEMRSEVPDQWAAWRLAQTFKP